MSYSMCHGVLQKVAIVKIFIVIATWDYLEKKISRSTIKTQCAIKYFVLISQNISQYNQNTIVYHIYMVGNAN